MDSVWSTLPTCYTVWGIRVASTDSFIPCVCEVLRILTTENVTANEHHDGIAPATYDHNAALNSTFRILSTNRDRNGKEFISTIEGISVSMYATQWHPERAQFDWDEHVGFSHTSSAVVANSWVCLPTVGARVPTPGTCVPAVNTYVPTPVTCAPTVGVRVPTTARVFGSVVHTHPTFVLDCMEAFADKLSEGLCLR